MRPSQLVGVWLAFVVFLGIVGDVRAHASLLRTHPANAERLAASPAQIVLWFDEELDTQASQFIVLNANTGSAEVPQGHVDLSDPDHARLILDNLPVLLEGVYIVRWRAVSLDDGFVAEGEFDFVVGAAAPRIIPTSTPLPIVSPPPTIATLEATQATVTLANTVAADTDLASEHGAWSPMVIAAGVFLTVALLVVFRGDKR